MKAPKIWVDCDGVLADFLSTYLRVLRELTGRSHERADVTDFDFAKCVASKDEDNQVWRHIDKTPGLVRSMSWELGAHAGLAALREMDDNVRCLTSPHIGPTWMPERAQWLLNRGFTKRQIVFCSDKALVPGDVFIEDKKETCEEWQAEHPQSLAVLFDAPYNQGPTSCVRANGWFHVTHLVREYLSERGDR